MCLKKTPQIKKLDKLGHDSFSDSSIHDQWDSGKTMLEILRFNIERNQKVNNFVISKKFSLLSYYKNRKQKGAAR